MRTPRLMWGALRSSSETSEASLRARVAESTAKLEQSSSADVEAQRSLALDFCGYLIEHFNVRAHRAKRLYERLMYASILFAVSVTVLSGIGAVNRWVVAVFGGLATLSTALLGATKAQELWVRQRGNHQQLQSERFLYLTGAGPYRDLDERQGVRLFSDRLMSTWSAGHGRWEKVAQEVSARQPTP